MKHLYSYYDRVTGLFTGQLFGTSDPECIALNVTAERPAMEGRHDHLSRRVDLSGAEPQVVDWQPPQPSADHEWDAGAKRWNLKAAVAAKQAQRESAVAQIRMLEASQARPHRELTLDPTNAEARKRLESIEGQITALRQHL